MRTSRILAACAIPFLLAGCNGNVLGGAAAACDSEEANRAVENLFKDELEFALQSGMAKTKQMGSYDATELEDSVQGIELNFADVRTSRDDPDSTRLSCKATMGIDLPDHVEKTANEVRLMAESVSVRDVANSHRLKRRNNMYSGDFDYFIQPTDDGEKLFAEIDDDSAPLQFLSEVITSYLLADEVRQAKVEEDLALAEEKRREREAKDAYEAEGQAALETAKVERKLASNAINATWQAMPQDAQNSIDPLHKAWVKQMKASCAADAAGSDDRASMRQASELRCQTRFVRSCTNVLRRNAGKSYSSNWSYCRVR